MALLIIPLLFLFLFKSTRGIAWFLFATLCFMMVGASAGAAGVIGLGVLAICVGGVFVKWSNNSASVNKDQAISPEISPSSPSYYDNSLTVHANDRRSMILSGKKISENIYKVGGDYGVLGPRNGSKLFKTLKGAEKYRDRLYGK